MDGRSSLAPLLTSEPRNGNEILGRQQEENEMQKLFSYIYVDEYEVEEMRNVVGRRFVIARKLEAATTTQTACVKMPPRLLRSREMPSLSGHGRRKSLSSSPFPFFPVCCNSKCDTHFLSRSSTCLTTRWNPLIMSSCSYWLRVKCLDYLWLVVNNHSRSKNEDFYLAIVVDIRGHERAQLTWATPLMHANIHGREQTFISDECFELEC